MATLADLIPDPSAVLALEPEELAGIALELLTSSGPNEPSRLHPSSITSPQTIGKYPDGQRQEGIGRREAAKAPWEGKASKGEPHERYRP